METCKKCNGEGTYQVGHLVASRAVCECGRGLYTPTVLSELCHTQEQGYNVWKCATACANLPNCPFKVKRLPNTTQIDDYQFQMRNSRDWMNLSDTTWLHFLKNSKQMEFRYSCDKGKTWTYVGQK
jgi:hypothetical protein